MDSIRLQPDLIKSLVASLRCLALSLDRAIHAPWPEVTTFFSEQRVEILQGILYSLEECTPPCSGLGDVEIENVYWIRQFYSKALSCAGIIELEKPIAAAIVLGLEDAIELISSADTPDIAEVTEIRLKLTKFEIALEQRVCKKLLVSSLKVEHFNASEHLTVVPLEVFAQ